jgi:hypothetical protein
MKRMVFLIVLMAFSAPASARDSYFTFHGHRIHISTLRHCRSLSCIRLSIPGLGYRRHNRDRDAGVDAVPDQVSPPAPVPAQSAPVPPPAPAPAQTSPAPAPPPVQTGPAPPLIQAQPVPAPEQPRPLSPVIAQVPMMPTRAPAAEPSARPHIAPSPAGPETTASTPNATPSVGFEVPKPPSAAAEKVPANAPNRPAAIPVANNPAAAAHPQPKAGPQAASTSDDSEQDFVDTPLGDWQTDGKNGLVRKPAAPRCAATCLMGRRMQRARPSWST